MRWQRRLLLNSFLTRLILSFSAIRGHHTEVHCAGSQGGVGGSGPYNLN